MRDVAHHDQSLKQRRAMTPTPISSRSTSDLVGTHHTREIAQKGEGRIQSRHYTYKVTYDGNNQQFSVGEGKLRPFAKLLDTISFGRYSKTYQDRAINIAHRLNTSLSLGVSKLDNLKGVVANLQSRSKEPTNNGELKQIATYGGTQARDRMIAELKVAATGNPAKFVTIDEYNACLGLSANSNAEDFRQLIQDIREGNLEDRIEHNLGEIESFAGDYISQGMSREEAIDVQKSKVKEWASFLTKNVDRIDVFANVLKQSDSELRAQITKNYNSTEANRIDPEKIRNAAQKAVSGQALTVGRGGDIGSGIFVTEFFRQTSKLGLEFFAEQGVPVVFAYNSLDNSGSVMDVRAIKTTPWKEGGYRDGQGSFNEGITYSEMRHVERLMNKLRKEEYTQAPLDMTYLNPYSMSNDLIMHKVLETFGEEVLNECGLSAPALRRALEDPTFMQGKEEAVTFSSEGLTGLRVLEDFEESRASSNTSPQDHRMKMAEQLKSERTLAAAKALVECAKSLDPKNGFNGLKVLAFNQALQTLADYTQSMNAEVEIYKKHREALYTPMIRDALKEAFSGQFSEREIEIAAQALHDSVIRDQDHALQYYPTDSGEAALRVQVMIKNAKKLLEAGFSYQPTTGGKSTGLQKIQDLVFAARGIVHQEAVNTLKFDVMGLSENKTNEIIKTLDLLTPTVDDELMQDIHDVFDERDDVADQFFDELNSKGRGSPGG